ncbi:MAG: endonuclease/exonuclease/phosphatase family protein [Kiloniellaceae bacterium]
MRIATFNLESLDLQPGGEAAFRQRAAVLRPQLEALQADILCLQEVNGQHVAGRDPGSGAGSGKPGRALTALTRLLAETAYDGFHLVASAGRAGHGVADVHNLVILSRRPAHRSEALRHRLVPPLPYHAVTARPEHTGALTLEWDRPLLHAAFETGAFGNGGGGTLHVINLHLRSPLAAPIPGQKLSAESWGSLAGWAEGAFTATMKRSGQALEARLLVERIFDAEPGALIAVCGDLNAGEEETPLRILQAAAEDSGNPALANRALEALEGRLPAARRYTVLHKGRRRMLDHILCSPGLAARCRTVIADNEHLPDEESMADDDPRSNHAPLVAEFDL